jgi:hypothetical protein
MNLEIGHSPYFMEITEPINSLITFREKMNSVLFYDFAISIWGKANVERFQSETGKVLPVWISSQIQQKKLKIANGIVNSLLIFNFVKFIGISGSIAARTVKEDDDIDVFIVVKNNTAWLYRWFIWLKNFRRGIIIREKIAFGKNTNVNNQKDRFCLNFIIEERALDKLDQTLFVFHELFSLIPLYNSQYYEFILSKNAWVFEDFQAFPRAQISKEAINAYEASFRKKSYLLGIFDFTVFCGQLVYQLIHKPDLSRVISNYKKGIIAYFPKRFKGYESKI